MEYAVEIALIILSTLFSLALSVMFQRPLERKWAKLVAHLRPRVRKKLDWFARQLVQVPVISIGVFLLIVTAIFQYVPFAMAATGALSEYPFYATVATVLIWELIVYTMLKIGLRLVRFGFCPRKDRPIDSLEFVPATIWKSFTSRL